VKFLHPVVLAGGAVTWYYGRVRYPFFWKDVYNNLFDNRPARFVKANIKKKYPNFGEVLFRQKIDYNWELFLAEQDAQKEYVFNVPPHSNEDPLVVSVRRMVGVELDVKEAVYPPGPFEDIMNWQEAKMILGIKDENPEEKVVRDAHRKLMILNHPDAGGSTYIAIKLNEAKAILLKEKGKEEPL